MTSLFSTASVNSAGVDGAFYGVGMELGKTLLVMVIIVPWFLVATWGCLWVTDKILKLRVSGETIKWYAGGGKRMEDDAAIHLLCVVCNYIRVLNRVVGNKAWQIIS